MLIHLENIARLHDNVGCLSLKMEILTHSSGYMFLIFLLTCIVRTAWTICSESCTEDNKDRIVTMCQSSATRLEEAELTGNASVVCKRFHELLLCAGQKVPQCLGMISEQYTEYTYTPWDCHLSNEQVISYQELVQKGCPSKSESKSGPLNYAANIDGGGSAQLLLGVIILHVLNS